MKYIKLILQYILSTILIIGYCVLVQATASEREYVHSCEYQDQQSELDSMKCNLYQEARGESEGVAGLYAVAFTTLNRVKSSRYPDTINGVVYSKYAFSWTRDGLSDRVYDRKSWDLCGKIARIVMGIKDSDWEFYDITGGALFYHAAHIHPYWADTEYKTVRINNHIFYKNDKKK